MNSPAAPSRPEASVPAGGRLLIISYEYPPLGGGLGKAVRETALQLAARGFEILILTSRFGDLPPDEADGPLRLVRIPVRRRHANHATLTDVLSFGVSGVMFGRRRLGDFRPDWILSYLTVPSGVVGAWLSRRLDAPHLTLLRGTDVPGHRELEPWMHVMAGPLIRAIWRRSARVISNSRSTARQAERAVRGLTVETVYNGVDLERFRPPEAGAPRAGPLRVIYSGRLVRVKRLELLLEVWAEVRERLDRPALLELAGYGPEREKLERRVAALGLGDSVRFLGYLDEGQMIRAYQEASVFVSLSADEGLPNSVLEALACGLPVVLSDIGPHREILGQSSAGALCDIHDPASVRDALLQLLRNTEKRDLAAERARSRVAGRFSWEKSAEDLIRLLPHA